MTEKEKASIEAQINLYRCLAYECMTDSVSSDYSDVRDGFFLQSRFFDERVDLFESLLDDLSYLSPS